MSDTATLPRTRRFRIHRVLGSGGEARVYLADDRYTGVGPVALKVFDAEGPRAHVVRALEEEFLALRELSHPGLVRVFERGVLPETGEPYYTSEYLEGDDFLTAARRASPEALRELTVRILRALEYIHRRGYVHCDLKPGNIIVVGEGEPKILDFGLAAREGQDGRGGGTLPYVAPETLTPGPVDRRADLYSLGIVLYQALLGELPPRGEDLLPAFDHTALLRLPAPFGSLIHRLVERDPARRPDSAATVIEMIAQAVDREIPVDTPETLRANLAGGRFVGREVELGTLMTEFRRLLLGEGPSDRRRILLVQGEAGIGKRRLIEEFRDRCQRDGVDFFSGRCFEAEEAPYGAMASALRGILARVGRESEAARTAEPVLSRVLPEIAGETVPESAGAEDRLRWLEEVAQFLREASRGPRGYVLAVEDIQHASIEMVELIGYLARSLCPEGEDGPPILFVLSMREGAKASAELRSLLADLTAEALVLPVRLRRFSEAEVEEFVRGLLGSEALPRRLVGSLHEKSGGNVFLLEQLLKSLVEEGSIYYRGDKCRVSDLSRVRIPDGVAQVLDRRLSSFSGEERSVLSVVAAYGEPIPVPILERVEPGATDRVPDLERRQVLVAPESGASVAFRHSLVAQYVLEHAEPRALRALHSRIGDALEAAAEEGGAVRTEKIAYHVSLSDDRRRALRYALRAAVDLEERGQHDQAALFFRRAVARLEQSDPRRSELLEALGDAHGGAGRLEHAVVAYRGAIEEAGDRPGLAALHLKLAGVEERTGEYGEAMEHVRTGLTLLDPADGRERIPYLRLLGAVHKQRGEYDSAIGCIREGLRLARGRPSEETISLLTLLGNVHMLRGDYRNALNLHLRALRFSESIEFDPGAATSLLNLGTLMKSWGETDRALTYFARALRISERLLALPLVALLYNNIGNIHGERGDYDRSEYYHKRSLAIRRRVGEPAAIAMSFGNIGAMHLLRGKWGLAVAYFERAIRHFDRIGNEYGAQFFRCHLADLLVRIGALERAEELLEVAETGARAGNHRRIEARVSLLRGRIERLRGDLANARRSLTHAIETDTDVAYREGVVEGGLELALVHRDQGMKGHALRAVAKAQAVARDTKSEMARARCRFIRGVVGSPEPSEGPLPSGRKRSGGSFPDLERYIEIARDLRRPDDIVEGLVQRGRHHLASADPESAATDFDEALRLTEEIAASLPEDLAAVYRTDSRRIVLRAFAEHARSERDRARPGEAGSAGGRSAAAEPVGTEADAGSPASGASEDAEATHEAVVSTADLDRMRPEDLTRLLEINKRLNSETDLGALLEDIMDSAIELTGAERGFLILVEGSRIAFQIARNFNRKDVEEPELKISQSIVKQVMKTGETVLTDNATEDERLSKFRSVDNLRLTSILSVPFMSRGVTIGALYLDNQANKGVFSNDDVETLKALSDQAAIAIQNLQKQERLTKEIETKDSELKRVRRALEDQRYRYDYSEIIGSSSRMRETFLLLDKIIDTEVPVLIQGESGTGKELIARAIHFKGPRKNGPFVTVNCAAVPDTLLESEFFGYVRGAFTGADSDKAGLFEQAHKGTLFLDEIGDMDFEMQKKLLRVLQQGEVRPVGGKKTVKVDVRIVCATNRDLRQLMLEQKFREDLFYRINVIAVYLPPLKERREDIPALVSEFVGRAAKDMGVEPKPVSQESMALLTAYTWPGNVRELENEMKKAVALSEEEIVADDLSPHIQGERAEHEPALVPSKGTLKETMEATEKSILVRALEETGGNQTQAAKNLGISRVWLRKKMEKYGLLETKD